MNQVHKVIWSRVKNCYIVVSEITKRVGRDNKASVTGIRPLRALLCAMVIAGCMLPADADAAPPAGLIHAGTGATASGDSSIAYGYGAKAKKPHAVAQGTEAEADGVYALAFGYKVQTLANYAMAMGHQAKAGANAIGGVAIGSSSVVEGEHGVALGDQAESKNKQTIAVGLRSVSSGEQSISIGHQANAKGNNSIAAGAGAKGYAKDGVAIGNNAESGTADNKDPRIPSIESNNGVAVGNSAKASGGSSVSVGNDSFGNGPSSVAIGNAATANDVRTTAIGNNAHAEGAGSLSIGREASALTLENATSTNPLVTGDDEKLDKKGVMAIGDDAKASGNNSIALGTSAKAGDLKQTRNSDSVTLTGSAKRITKLTSTRAVNNAVAIGTESSVQSDEDIAVGYRATTVASKYHQRPGSGQVAIGSNSNTYGTRGDVAIGSGAETNIRVKNVDHTTGAVEKPDGQSVAIGSVAKAYGSQAVAVGADTRAIGNSSVAIGTDDIELDREKLETLLPGLANNENLNNKAPNDATLGSAALGDKSYYVKTASIGTASVALGAMSQAAGDASMAMGLNALAEGDASTAIGPLARSKGKKSIAMGVNANSQVDGGVALGADSVSNRQQTSNAYIPSGADTAQVNAIKATKGTTGAVSVGSDTVKRQIINVAAGTNDSDAVNVAQLKAVTSNASWTVQGNGSDVNAVKNGSKVNFADGINTTASVTKDASGKVTTVKYNLKKDVDLGPNGSLIINGNTYINKDGINAGNKQITNVASGGNVTTNAANIGDINRIVTAKDKYVTGGTATYQTNGDGMAALTGTNGLTAKITGLKNNYVTSGSVSNDGKTLTLERNDTGKVNVDLSKIFTEVAKEDYHLVANPEAGSQGKYKADSNGNMVLTVANEKGDKKQVTLTDIASKAQQNTNTTNITNINNTIAKGLNFKGDDATVINKKLGEQLDIKGGADASKLTDGNIGVVSGNGALNVKLAKDVTGLNSVTAGTARMGVDSADHKSYVTGLDNRDWDVQNPVVVNGRAATEDQLKKVSDAISTTTAAKTDFRLVKNPDAADGNYSVANGKVDLKVEDKAHPTTPASTVTINNIASASDVEKLKAGFKVKAGTNEGAIKAGETLEFAAKDNAGVEYDPAARKLTVSVSKDPTFNSVTVGDVKINNTGINAGNKQITNVASGGNVTTNAANIGDINRIVTAKDKYVTGGTATYQTNGDGTAALTGTNGLTANITGLKNNYVTSGSVSNDGKTLTLERNDTGKVNVDLSKIFTEVAKEDYHLVANPEAGSQGKYKADSNGNMVLTVANEKGEKKQVTLTDIASKAQQNINTTNITNINNTIAKGLNFGGDSGADINKKLGDKLEIKGGASADLTDGNIGVVSDGAKLNVKLKKDVNLGADGSLTINGKTYVNKDGLNANNQKITNVADGTANSDAVNLGQLNAAIGGTAKATTVKAKDANVTVTEGTNAAGGKEYTVGLGDKVTLGSAADKKIIVDGTSGKITAGSKVTIDGTTGDIQAGTVKVTGAGTVNELTNRTWDIDNPTVVHGQAATEDQLKTVSDGVKTNKTDITNINTTIGKGLNFKGDDATVINKKLGEQLDIKGGADASKLSDGNIGVVSGNGALNVKLAKDVKVDSVTTGGTVINNNGLTVDGKTYVTNNGLNANNQKITNVADGTVNSDAVNFGQLKDAVAAGKTILKDGKNTTVEGEGTVANPYKVNVNDDLVLGKKGADGKDGSIGVNGKDGSAVVINGKDGSIGLNGKDGANGLTIKGGDGKPGIDGTNITRLIIEEKDGKQHDVATLDDGLKFAGNTGIVAKKLNETMTIKGTGVKADTEYDASNIKTMVNSNGEMIVGLDKNLKTETIVATGKDGKDGKIGINGKDGVTTNISVTRDGKPGVDGAPGTTTTRIVYEKPDGTNEEVATLNDGMKYGGDTGAVIKKKLNEQVNVVGGISDESKLTTDDNIGVVSDGSNNLKVRLAKNINLGPDGSLTINGKTYVNKDGLNANGQKITNVANGTVNSDAVNFGQLKDAVAAGKTILKDGKNTTVEGEGTVANPYKVNVNDDLVLGKKGADGKDGSIGVNGKDGSAVVINGKDGSIGLNGKDGANGLTIKGGDGKPGIDGTNITRLIIEEKDGKQHDVATLDDGLKFAGNTGIVAKKLNETMTIKGTGVKADTEYDASNIKTMVNSNGEMIVGLDKNLKTETIVATGKDGKDGKIGINGKDGVTTNISVTRDGKPGVDGAPGTTTTRIVYEKPDGTNEEVATLNDGMKYGGDTGAVIKKKLNEQVNVVGGISDESKLTTDDNIGVVSDGSNNLKVRLAKNINLGPDGSLTINGKTYVNKDGLNANGQKITNVANGTVNSDAVNFGQLKDAVAAGKTILKDGKNTTVEGEGTVANPYKVNVNDDLVLGKKGADGKDGSIGVNGKDGSSVVIHGKDGISIKGKDGKDGVTLKAKDGANGTEGQIGLTGPAGKDGKSTHADIGVNAGPASLDPAKNLSATEMTRLYYVDEKGDHQVATMDDGMKFAGNTGLAVKKLNSTMTIKGTGTKADTEYDASNIKTMVNGNGEMIVGLDKNLKADSVGINGKDGRDGVTIKGGDGKPGVDGTNITRLIIEEKNGKQHDIATLDDGMKYGGDTGAVIKKKLNEQVNVVGGITDESKLTTDDNIGVVSDGSNNLKVRLAKDVKLNSVTAGNVVMDTTGFYVKKMSRTPTGTVSLTADGLNNGGNKIINVAEGTADTDAVNFSQLKNQGSDIINKGFGVKAEDGNEVKKKLGETVDVVGDGKNISTRVEGGRVRVALKDDILLNSVTTGQTRMDTNGITVQDGSGNTAVTVDKDGLKIKDGPSVTKTGIDAGGKKITNVAEGTADTDAVNVSQLKKAAAGATTKVADGKNTTVTSETNSDGSKTYHVNLNDDITLGTDPSKQISIKGTEGTIKAGQVTVNGTAGTVNNLTNKTWDPNNITSGQAATEDQLKVVSGQAGKHSSVTAGSNISVTTGTNANGGTEYKVAVVDTPTFKTVTTGNTVMSNSGLTIKNGPSITQTGVDAGGKRITNVAAGKADTDAVNVSQLKQIGGAINKVDNRINRVGAGAAALAALHPLDFDPDDKWDFTVGYGNYKDAHSMALGAFYRPNEDTMISVGGSIGGGENMVNAGLSVKLGQGNHVSTSKVAMAKEIKDLRSELENVKGALLKVADGRPLDSMDMDKMQLFPDVPENHWAYDYVATLAGNGVIVGYPDGQFGGDRMMTRYEMAALIYRAMQNGAAADDRMARALKEFEPELERIRVDTISKHKDGTPDIQRVRVIKGRG